MTLFAVFMAGLMFFTLRGDWQWPHHMARAAWERVRTGYHIDLVPHISIKTALRRYGNLGVMTNIWGNIFMFVPWGFGLPLLWRRFRRFWRMAGMCLALTVFIEFTQLFIGRYVEMNDVVLNFLGGMLGAGLWWLMHRLLPSTDVLAG